MKTNTGKDTFHLMAYILIFLLILLHSCATTSTSVVQIEGDDFEKNLPGLWEGKWSAGGYSGKQHINILKIDGNHVKLTGFMQGFGAFSDTDEVNGQIEKSRLLLTWPDGPCKDKYRMKRDDSNNLILYGPSVCESAWTANVQLKKSE